MHKECYDMFTECYQMFLSSDTFGYDHYLRLNKYGEVTLLKNDKTIRLFGTIIELHKFLVEDRERNTRINQAVTKFMNEIAEEDITAILTKLVDIDYKKVGKI